MGESADIQIQILSEPRNLCVVRAAVATALTRMGMSQDETNAMVSAVDEAVTNVMRHGYHGATDRPIWVRVLALETAGRCGVEIQVTDETSDVDLDQIRRLPPTSDQLGGRGVHIIYEAADEVDYSAGPDGRGLCLTLRKYHGDGAAPFGETG